MWKSRLVLATRPRPQVFIPLFVGLVDPAHRGAHIAGSALGLPLDVVVVMCAPKVLRIQWVIWAGFANVRSAFRSSLSAKPALIVLSMLALYSRS
jgi:hypothetical protein